MRRRNLTHIFLICAATAGVFWTSLGNGLTNWDDEQYVTRNERIKELSAEHIGRMFQRPTDGFHDYYPLTHLTLALDYRIGGEDPFAYHAQNLFWHLARAVFIYLFILTLTRHAGVAFITGLLSGVHPMMVESVAWVSERKDVLHAAFYFMGLWWYTRACRRRSPALIRVGGAGLFFLAAILSKPAAVTFPLALLAVDYYLNRKIRVRDCLDKLPLFAISVLFGLMLVSKSFGGAEIIAARYPLWERVFFVSYNFWTAIARLVVPVDLQAFYPYPDRVAGQLPALFYVSPMIVALIGVGVWVLRRRRGVVFGLLFFCVTVFLTLGFRPLALHLFADRYVYIPSVGIFLWMALGFFALVRMAKRHHAAVFHAARVMGAAYVLVMMVMTVRQIRIWENGVVLWSSVIERYPGQWTAYLNRSEAYVARGEPEKALADLNRVEELGGTSVELFVNRALVFLKLERPGAAMDDFREALQINPRDERALYNLANLYYQRRDLNVSLEEVNRALEVRPDYIEALKLRVDIYDATGEREAAIEDLTALLKIIGDKAPVYFQRGTQRMRLGDHRGAEEDFRELLERDSQHALGLNNLAILYARRGLWPQSLGYFNKAIRAKPSYGEAYYNRSMVFQKMRRPRQAEEDLQTARQLGYDRRP